MFVYFFFICFLKFDCPEERVALIPISHSFFFSLSIV